MNVDFGFSGHFRGVPVAGTVSDGVLEAPTFVIDQVSGMIEHDWQVSFANMSGPATLRGPLAPATIRAALDPGSVFTGLVPLGPELPDEEGALAESWGNAAAKAKQAADQLRVGGGNEGGGQFTRKIVPAVGKGGNTGAPGVGTPKLDSRDIFGEDGKTIFGHTLPPGVIEATPEQKAAARIPKGYPFGFIMPGGEATPAGVVGWGVDSQGRVKRFYTPEKEAERAKAKFQRIRKLTRKLQGLDADLAKDSLEDDRAAVALLVRVTGMRPGSTGKTGGKVQAFGATTLKAEHVTVDGDLVAFDFVGKNGKPIQFEVVNHLLARALAPHLEGKAAGDQIFPKVTGEKVNAYLKAALGAEFKTKDLRTALATATAQAAVRELDLETLYDGGINQRKAARKRIAEQISERLGNTPAEVIKSYVDPQVWEPLGL